ncbi:hypothetical protein D3C71_1274930 [compost metagenome]
MAEVGLVRLQGEGQGEGHIEHSHVGAEAFRVVDEPQIRHLLFQQLAVGLIIPAEMGRLEGGIGVAVEHETGAADGQQDALIAGKLGEGACRLDGGRAQPVVKIELVQARARGGDKDLGRGALLVFPGHLQLVRLFNQGDHVGASTRSGRVRPSDTIPQACSQGAGGWGRSDCPECRHSGP